MHLQFGSYGCLFRRRLETHVLVLKPLAELCGIELSITATRTAADQRLLWAILGLAESMRKPTQLIYTLWLKYAGEVVTEA